MDIEVGSNLYRNSNGIIDIEGVPQFEVAIKESVRALLVNFALFDDVGRMMAKVVDSNLTFNERRAYQLAKSPTSVSLKHEESGTVVFTLELREGNRVVFSRGTFHTIKGHDLMCRRPNGESIRNTSAARKPTCREVRCSWDSGTALRGTVAPDPCFAIPYGATVGTMMIWPSFKSTIAVSPSRSSPLINWRAIGVSISC